MQDINSASITLDLYYHARRSIRVVGYLLALLVLSQVHAQPPPDEEQLQEQEIDPSPEAQQESADDEDQKIDEIVVTGSRIQRSNFNTISPVQVLSGSTAREAGLIDAASFLQSTTAATGQQLDNTYGGFVTDNGPGGQQVNLRGLGANRTLIMINGRRLSSAGIGGAPVSPDISLIPRGIIDRLEVVLDGASSLYGSDAVAGAVNVILKTDVRGFQFQADYQYPELNRARQSRLSALWGTSTDRLSIIAAVEDYRESALKAGDLKGLLGCDEYREIDENGVIRNYDTDFAPGATIQPCPIFPLTNRIQHDSGAVGSVYYTPGYTNIAIPNFSESGVGLGLSGFVPTARRFDLDSDGVLDYAIIDGDGDGLNDVDLASSFYCHPCSERGRREDFQAPYETQNLYVQFEYDLGLFGNASFFSEFMYSRREYNNYTGTSFQLFQWVPVDNPTNPCGTQSPNNCWGHFIIGGRPFQGPPTRMRPILNVQGDRDVIFAELQAYRYVAGLKGDLVFLESDQGYGDWSYEFYVTHTSNLGESSRQGILEPELVHSVNTTVADGEGNLSCPDFESEFLPGPKACVPVNLFAPNLYQDGGGALTPEEAAYLFGNRIVETQVWQTVASFSMQGDVWQLPWNQTLIPLVLGYEYRRDSIDTGSNAVTTEGLLWGFFKDRGAEGARHLNEFYVETELLLLNEVPLAHQLVLNLSARHTQESTYGNDWTYSIKGSWSPARWLTWRAAYGTSFRTPNAREQFLLGTSGFLTLTDPCVVPDAARTAPTPGASATYDESRDRRTPELLANCETDGLDPRSLGLEANISPLASREVLQQGGEVVRSTILPESSRSITAGLVLEPDFGEAFDFSASITYYDIQIENSIVDLGPADVISFCYNSLPDERRFCPQVKRNAGGFIEEVEYSFRNFAEETARGIDLSVLLQKELVVNDRIMDLSLDLNLTRLSGVSSTFEDDTISFQGRTAFPDLEGIAVFAVDYNRLRFFWRTAYINQGTEPPPAFSSTRATCRYAVPDTSCRPVFFTVDYWRHSAGLNYTSPSQTWAVGFTVTNIFDKQPPRVDSAAAGTQRFTTPLGVGYDFVGRSYLLSLTMNFGDVE